MLSVFPFCSSFVVACAWHTYAHNVSKKNNPLSTSLRSVIQATDSTRRKTVPVQLVLETRPESIELIKARLEESGIRVVRVGEHRFRESINVVLIGHVVHTGIQDTIDEIDKTGFAEVVDLSLSMPGINSLSSALIRIDAVGKEDMQRALAILKEVSVKKDLLLVLPIDIQA